MPQTRYEQKVARIRAGRDKAGDLIIAGGRDAALSGGIDARGRCDEAGRPVGNRTRAEFVEEIAAFARQDVVDTCLSPGGRGESGIRR